MRGAIIGDIIGSAFVKSPQSITEFQLLKPFSAYTDDTVLTIATADAIMNDRQYSSSIRNWVQKYPKAGYRKSFLDWVLNDRPDKPYKSSGDGAARRIGPVGYAAKSLYEALYEAESATIVTHPDISKVKASQAYAGSIYLAKTGKKKEEIRDFLKSELGYILPDNLEKDCINYLMKDYDSPVPCALLAFLHSESFEDAIRKAIWLEGPSNTFASIAGGLAQAYFRHIPKSIIRKSLSRISKDMEDVLFSFEQTYCKDFIAVNNDIQFFFH